MTLRCIIAGSRTIDDARQVDAAFRSAPFFAQVTEVVSGGAAGVDTLARSAAEAFDLPFTEMLADWDRHGRRAGYLRNVAMAEYAKAVPPGALVAVWDGVSRGTKHMIDIGRERGLLVHVVTVPSAAPPPPRGPKFRSKLNTNH